MVGGHPVLTIFGESPSFTAGQAEQFYVWGPLTEVGGSTIGAASEIIHIAKVSKSTGCVKIISASFKADKKLMKDLGYNWVKSQTRASGGYWRRSPHSKIKSPKKVNTLVETVLNKVQAK